MRQLTFVRPGSLEWREVPAPEMEGPGEAIVRPIAAATCDIDPAFIDGRVPTPGEFPFGHEGVAEVVAVGAAVTAVKPGDRVVVPFQLSCGGCAFCRRGLTANCTSVPYISTYGMPFGAGALWGGFLSDLVRVPFADAMLVPVPDRIAPAVLASASDNLPDAWRAVGPYLAESPGAEVLILAGGGSIPLYAATIARALGAGRVDYMDTDPNRLALAASLGANALEGPPPKRLGPYAITVDATGRPEGLASALRSTEPGGVCTSVSIYWNDATPMPLFEMYSRANITFRTGRVNARAVIPAVLDLVASGRLHPELVTSRVVSWEEAPEALLGGGWTKLVMTRDSAAPAERAGSGQQASAAVSAL